MVISDEKRLIFFHISKCGGVSIEDFLFGDKENNELYGLRDINGEIIALQHITYHKLKELDLIGDRLDNYYKFAVVRNPYARLVSDYRWLVRKEGTEFLGTSFKEYLKIVARINNNKLFYQSKYYDHFLPQSEYLLDRDGNQILNETVKLENLDEYYKKNFNQELPHKNHTGEYDFLGYYDQEDIKLVNELYANDFKLLNYLMIDPKQLDTINYYRVQAPL